MEETFYPDIKIVVHNDLVKVNTTLRKKHMGKWYFWRFFEQRKFGLGNGVEVEVHRLLAHIHREVYATIIYGKVNPKLYIMGDKDLPIFTLDPIQKSEKDRLKEKYSI